MLSTDDDAYALGIGSSHVETSEVSVLTCGTCTACSTNDHTSTRARAGGGEWCCRSSNQRALRVQQPHGKR